MNRSMLVFVALGAVACARSTAAVTAPPAPAPAPVAVQAPPPPVVQPTPPATAPAAPFDAEGTYELQIAFGGQALPVALEIWRENGKWYGTANSSIGGADLSAFTQDGRKLQITIVAQGGPTFVLNLDVKADNTVTGTWSGNNDGSPITGKKVK